MGVIGYISAIKKQMRERENVYYKKKEAQLQALQSERIRQENFAKIRDLETKEKTRIQQLKTEERKQKFAPIMNAIGGLKKYKSKRQSMGIGIYQSKGTPPVHQRETPYWLKGNSEPPYWLRDKPKQQEQKPQNIIIKIGEQKKQSKPKENKYTWG